MIDSISIANFRGIEEGQLSQLAPLTILMGPNNSGKSTCLEAMSIAWSSNPATALNAVARRRGWLGVAALEYLIGTTGARLAIQGNLDTGKRPVQSVITIRRDSAPSAGIAEMARQAGLLGQASQFSIDHELRAANVVSSLHHALALDESGHPLVMRGGDAGGAGGGISSVFVDAHVAPESLSESLSQADSAGEEAHVRLIGYLRHVDAGIREVRARQIGQPWIPHVYYANRTIPLAFSGDGIIRMFTIAGRLAPLREATVFMEEPECYQHTRSLEQLTRILWDSIDAGNQVIASTHSLELLDMLTFEAANRKDGLERTALQRLGLADGVLSPVRVPGADIATLRQELAEDLRR